jgi:hypothetical protein
MKNGTFFFLLLLCSIPVLAQSDSSKVAIRLVGGYNDVTTSNGVASMGAVNSTTAAWNLGLSVGVRIDKNWEIGLGAEYQKQNQATSSILHIPEQWIAFEETDTKAHILMGKLYAAYYWKLVHRLYFNPKVELAYGELSGKQENRNAYIRVKTPGIVYPYEKDDYYFGASEQDISSHYLAAALVPTFSFFFSKRVAAFLETGRFQLEMIDAEWDNRQWTADLNPASWRVGIMVTF